MNKAANVITKKKGILRNMLLSVLALALIAGMQAGAAKSAGIPAKNAARSTPL